MASRPRPVRTRRAASQLGPQRAELRERQLMQSVEPVSDSGPLRLPPSRVRASRPTAEVLDELRSDR
jgi:hypothetical protein